MILNRGWLRHRSELERLAADWQQGDRDAFTQLIEPRVASAYRLASAMLGDADVAAGVRFLEAGEVGR